MFGVIAATMHDGPVGMPVSFAREGDRILFHGSTGSHRMRVLSAGTPVCFTITATDALSVGRSAFETGMRYRSAMIFGACRPVPDEEKETSLNAYVDRYLPGRSSEVRPVSGKEIAATMVLSLPIQTWSMKVSSGWPTDDGEDITADAWMGLIPLYQGVGEPQSGPGLGPDTAMPSSVQAVVARYKR